MDIPNRNQQPKLLILGGGPTGLGAAYRLQERRYQNWLLCEREPWLGGLSASFKDDAGFTWDIGGHVVFSHYPEFDAFFQDLTCRDCYRHVRKSFVHLLDRDIPYPFQNNIRHLPPDALDYCLEGLEEAANRTQGPDRSNFLAWNLSRFGEGITRLFIEPDNLKRWNMPLDQLSANWVADRVSPVDLDRILHNIENERDDVDWGPNNSFLFPRLGGTGGIFEAMRPRIQNNLRLQKEAVEIHPEEKIVFFNDGSSQSYDHLLTTLPIDLLFEMLRGAPPELVRSARELNATDAYIVGIGLRGTCETDTCWMYCPEHSAPFFRVTFFTNYSPHNAPDENHYSIMCDTCHSPWNPIPRKNIIDETIDGLLAAGILQTHDLDNIVSTFLIDQDYAYPIPTLKRDTILAALHEYLENIDIASRGRFGAWMYEIGNMDHCFMMGRQWVENILGGERESVFLDRR